MLGVALIIMGGLIAVSSFGFFRYIWGGKGETGMLLAGLIGILCIIFGGLLLL